MNGAAILDSEQLPPAPSGELEPGVRYPLAFDRVEDVGAVTFAVRDLHPGIARGVWCLAVYYRRVDGVWAEAGEHDNTTTAHPFERWAEVENSTVPWIDWHSNDPHVCFGIAPSGTARLTVTTEDGTERELRIDPQSGAYVAVGCGRTATLSGYGADGTRLGQLAVHE